MEEENYLTAGFDKFLTRVREAGPEEILEDESSLRIDKAIGSHVSSGKTTSPDGLLEIDWDRKRVTVSDKARDRVIVGYISEEDKYGVRVIDSTGTAQLDETY